MGYQRVPLYFPFVVSSWDGGKSTIDQEVIHERRKEKKRNWEEDYEEDLDKGKVRLRKARVIV